MVSHRDFRTLLHQEGKDSHIYTKPQQTVRDLEGYGLAKLGTNIIKWPRDG